MAKSEEESKLNDQNVGNTYEEQKGERTDNKQATYQKDESEQLEIFQQCKGSTNFL